MWFDKKEKAKKQNIPSLPDLPFLPDLPELPSAPQSPNMPAPREKLPALPSFPTSDTGNKIGQFAIKSALEPPSKQRLESPINSRLLPKPKYTQELPSEPEEQSENEDEAEENLIELKRSFEVPKRTPEFKPEFTSEESRGSKAPVFVRIDKFQIAVKNLQDIRKQISDIEAYLSEIKNIKVKEEHELSEWEKQISEIKTKLESLDRSVFSKLD